MNRKLGFWSAIQDPLTEYIAPYIRSQISDSDKLFLFGSRAAGSQHQYSDRDIAIEADAKITGQTIRRIKSHFEETPYRVDIVALGSGDPYFEQKISSEMVAI